MNPVRKHLYGAFITSFTAATGTTAGGTAVTLAGRFFTGATDVQFGGVSLTSLVVVSDIEITGVTGAHAAGAVDVTVDTPVMLSAQSGLFTYVVPNQIVSSVTPDNGTNLGGTPVTIAGFNFTGSDIVVLESVGCTSVVVVDDNTITCVTGANPLFTGVCNCSVEQTAPPRSGLGVGLFTYNAP